MFIFLLVFSMQNAGAQEKDYNQFSIEVNLGATLPLRPATVDRSEFVGLPQVGLGARYMFNRNFGLRGQYHYDRFGTSSVGLSMHRLGLEAVANMGNLLGFPYQWRKSVGLLMHSGIGAGTASPRQGGSVEHIGTFLVGLTPQIKLNNRFSLVGDLSFTTNFKQHYGYNGLSLQAGESGETGGMLSASIGIQIYLGKEYHHADWY